MTKKKNKKPGINNKTAQDTVKQNRSDSFDIDLESLYNSGNLR